MKEELLKLINQIKIEKGLTQGEISEMAGYAPNYITSIISRNQVSRKVLNNVQRVLNENSALIKDAVSPSLEIQMEMLATGRVILSALAELQAERSDRMPSEIAGTYQRMVKDQKSIIFHELKQEG